MGLGLGGIKHEGMLIHMRRPRFAFDHFVCCILFLIDLLPPFAPIQDSFNAFKSPSFLAGFTPSSMKFRMASCAGPTEPNSATPQRFH